MLTTEEMYKTDTRTIFGSENILHISLNLEFFPLSIFGFSFFLTQINFFDKTKQIDNLTGH